MGHLWLIQKLELAFVADESPCQILSREKTGQIGFAALVGSGSGGW